MYDSFGNFYYKFAFTTSGFSDTDMPQIEVSRIVDLVKHIADHLW